MLVDFFLHLKAFKLPVSTREYLTLIEALDKRVVSLSLDDFYTLSRLTLVKDEQHFDRFDLAFGAYFKGIEGIFDIRGEIPEEWLKKEFLRHLSEEDRKRVEAMGGLDKLLETFKQRLEEQKQRHQGGKKWIGTGGTSPFGAYGYNPEGIRVGQDGGGARSAVKVWDARNFRNLDGDVELNTRNLKVALRRLRRFAREGVPEELDLDGTIEGTARNAGWLDLRLQPERRNRVKVLLFLDVGGSMDPHVTVCEELFSAAKSEFRHLKYFYFHNCVYDHVWRDNARRKGERASTLDLIRTYGPDWRVIFVGDAAMSPYELTAVDGSVEYRNIEPGLKWLGRIFGHFRKVIWWNPEPARGWEYTRSTQLILQALGPRMFPLTLDGVARGIDALR
ncbi:MAG TPA: VWA domain-containing protein, partial [Casimicrobiaceae bacterium]